MIHLICGPIGAGKTTLAHDIAKEYGAIRFSEDEWLSELFVPNAPENLMEESIQVIGEWASGKYQLCRVQIWQVCEQLLSRGVSIVLDGAAANKEQRDLIRKKAKKHNVDFQLHFISADKEVRRERVLDRNSKKGKTYSIEVNQEMFDHMEVFFEPPKHKELKGALRY
ncbi:hypothetical protein A9Q84_13635 [Halobacteriovorax marinus]|uniref:Kinase n=1 Tax=Halobacteriovorax marinus TaxID=97084 RepID=A0A1Y5FD37_9BACT|nr:hypothetical protein A9Q84_13635 [Halobacteriovorax marinus]